jgi:hypothetical protein
MVRIKVRKYRSGQWEALVYLNDIAYGRGVSVSPSDAVKNAVYRFRRDRDLRS